MSIYYVFKRSDDGYIDSIAADNRPAAEARLAVTGCVVLSEHGEWADARQAIVEARS